MGQKKGKKKKTTERISILNEIDNNLNHTYKDIIDEIETIQYELNVADSKELMKQRKKMKKKGNKPYTSSGRIRARKVAVEKMESTNILERILHLLQDLAPIVIIMARLIASLILAILSIDPIKRLIKPETLDMMSRVYKQAMAVC